MEAKELRIENWVEIGRKENGDFLIGQVEGLQSDLMGGTVKIKNHDRILLTQQLFPIPLTEEWLLKFGFAESGDYYVLNDIRVYAFHRRFSSENFIFDFGMTNTYVELEYVHDIQNLYFTLSGEELTVAQPALNQ